MNSFVLKRAQWAFNNNKLLLLLLSYLLVWHIAPMVIRYVYPLAGLIDAGILQLILLAFFCWFSLLIFSSYLAKVCYTQLTRIIYRDQSIGPQTLTSWQHHILYLASYALLVLSASMCLMAIC